MKLAIRISVIAILLAFATGLKAQSFKLEVGYYNPGYKHSMFASKDTSSTYFNGMRVGLTVEFPMKHHLSLLTGAMYSFVYSNKEQLYRSTQGVNFMSYGQTIQIPVRLQYNIPLNKSLKAFVNGGPTLQYGLSLRRGLVSTLDTTLINYTGLSSQMQNMYSSSLVHRLNLQVGLAGGVQWKKYMLKSGYDFGLLNMNKGTTKKLYEGAWFITFGVEL